MTVESEHELRRGRSRAALFGAAATLTDLLPPYIRYGYVHRATARFLRGPVGSLARHSDLESTREAELHESSRPDADLVCALALDDLDVGGIGSVIETLAMGLPAAGITPIVVGNGRGPRVKRLRNAGIEVRSCADPDQARSALERVDVVSLHSASRDFERAAIASGLPLVTVMHNTEIHFTERRWRAFAELLGHSAVGVAVSETVLRFHARHVPGELAARLSTVPNGAPATEDPGPDARRTARVALEEALDSAIADTDVVFVCLARYDSQKNVAGTVASFAHALDTGMLTGARLVYAGEPSDRVEYLRADGIRRSSPHADRIHLLANSDAYTLLAAGDAFLLNSFFEGWPVAATEAAAAGLPLILSDVGGGCELVSQDPGRSILIANASGDAASVSDARVRAARRRSTAQPNRDELVAALTIVAARVRADRSRIVPMSIRRGATEMVKAHADVIRRAHRSSHLAEAGRA